MARFYRLPAVSTNTEDEEKRELMGLDNLPVETGISYIHIDLDRVESFTSSEDENDYTEILMHSGLHAVIAMSIDEFITLING